QKLNEYIMVSLRTMEGLDLSKIRDAEKASLLKKAAKFMDTNKIAEENNYLKLTLEGKLLADGIAASLFF
ncbi:MAG TPA: hypothetical protein VLJ68_13035, partial [Chitinophagaceae bacterium]|nr:hypothetical protein [Chitinophagaceae bacterium]